MLECPSCGVALPSGARVCTRCNALVHADQLKRLSAEASAVTDPTEALRLWRDALDLLPPGSRQARVVRRRIHDLVDAVDGGTRPDEATRLGRLAGLGGALGTFALFAWKAKTVVLVAATKGKLLLVGLTKLNVLASMFVSLGVYAVAFGWRFAVGLLVSLYVHEMGHVHALQRYGIRASAPMFVPGLGAYVRLEQYPTRPREDAAIGLAGPTWGIGAALAAWIAGSIAGWPSFVAIGKVAGWLNLFNLIPVWQLDGARGLRAADRTQRLFLLTTTAGMWLATGDGILLLVGAVLAWRTWADPGPERGSWRHTITFAVVLAIGAAMTRIVVPGADGGTFGG